MCVGEIMRTRCDVYIFMDGMVRSTNYHYAYLIDDVFVTCILALM